MAAEEPRAKKPKLEPARLRSRQKKVVAVLFTLPANLLAAMVMLLSGALD